MRLARVDMSRCAAAAVLLAGVGVAGCGSSSSSSSSSSTAAKPTATPSTLALTISEAGKSAKYTAPASVKGGLVTVQLTNNGKAPHSAQLLRLLANHTVLQAEMALGGSQHKTPSWVRFEGGVGSAEPGASASATVELPAGKYIVVDLGKGGRSNRQAGPPALTTLAVLPGPSASLPSAPITVTATAPSKDHYKWRLSGALKAGVNNVTFASKGSQALHRLIAVRVTGNPSKPQILKALQSNGPTPSFVDQASITNTAALDGGKSLTTQLTLSKPGDYVLFCPLTDRDGGKPHFAEGLLTTITVQ